VENRIREEIMQRHNCTFKPNISNSDYYIHHNSSTGNLLDRIEQWVEYKEKKIDELKSFKELQFRDSHTFAPKVIAKAHLKSLKQPKTKGLRRSESSYSQLGIKYLKYKRKGSLKNRMFM